MLAREWLLSGRLLKHDELDMAVHAHSPSYTRGWNEDLLSPGVHGLSPFLPHFFPLPFPFPFSLSPLCDITWYNVC